MSFSFLFFWSLLALQLGRRCCRVNSLLLPQVPSCNKWGWMVDPIHTAAVVSYHQDDDKKLRKKERKKERGGGRGIRAKAPPTHYNTGHDVPIYIHGTTNINLITSLICKSLFLPSFIDDRRRLGKIKTNQVKKKKGTPTHPHSQVFLAIRMENEGELKH